MLKLVGDDVRSIEQFMARYRVSISTSCLLLALDHDGLMTVECARWTIRRPSIEYKSVSLPQLNTRAKQVPKRRNGWQRRRRCVHMSFALTGASLAPLCIRYTALWSIRPYDNSAGVCSPPWLAHAGHATHPPDNRTSSPSSTRLSCACAPKISCIQSCRSL